MKWLCIIVKGRIDRNAFIAVICRFQPMTTDRPFRGGQKRFEDLQECFCFCCYDPISNGTEFHFRQIRAALPAQQEAPKAPTSKKTLFELFSTHNILATLHFFFVLFEEKRNFFFLLLKQPGRESLKWGKYLERHAQN